MSSLESPALATAVVAALASHVRDCVICPGSRNAPLTLALLARRDIRVHVRIDERAAAFCALGIARTQRRPVAVVMTSGTAVANCLPAVIEARQSHTPLVICSADRPRWLVGKGASQTIDQVGLFGGYAPTVQVAQEADVPAAARAMAQHPQLHLNIALDVPLIAPELPELTGKARPIAGPRPGPHQDHGSVALDISRDTLVIAGDEAWAVPGLEDVPTIAEPSAPAPYVPVHPLAAQLLSAREAAVEGEDRRYAVRTKPEQVVVVGHPTLHRPVLALMSDPDIAVTVLTRTETATDPAGHAAQIGSRVTVTGEPSARWLDICSAASELAATAVRDALANPDFGFTGLHVAAAVTDSLAVGDTAFIAASNPVRDVSMTGLPFDGVHVITPRGAAGIDGSVSQAIGMALAAQEEDPTAPRAPRAVALLGDLAFLHDAGGLLIGPLEARPENLTIVVANDDGGGIFEALEPGADPLRNSFERGFATPHGADIAGLCQAYHVDYLRADSLEELQRALESTTDAAAGITVIEARTVRDTRRALHAALNQAVAL